jgi:hypothetical protein
VTARAGSDTSPTFQGKEGDLDKLIQQAAEAVYRSTQPYRYAVYLDGHNRAAEAKTIYGAVARQRLEGRSGLGLYRARQSIAGARRFRRGDGRIAALDRHRSEFASCL